MDSNSLITFDNASIGYSENCLIKPFTLGVGRGELIALMGLNGSGKTTLFKTILKEIPLLNGEIKIKNKPISSQDLKSNISIVYTDRVSIYGFTVHDLVAMGRMPHTNRFGKLTKTDNLIINRTMKQMQLADIANLQIDSLSDGQFQKAMIARALTQETPILLLDEPTAFLDIKNKSRIYSLLKELTVKHNKTIFVSTHQIEFCKSYCDKVWLIKEGCLTEKKGTLIKEEDFD